MAAIRPPFPPPLTERTLVQRVVERTAFAAIASPAEVVSRQPGLGAAPPWSNQPVIVGQILGADFGSSENQCAVVHFAAMVGS